MENPHPESRPASPVAHTGAYPEPPQASSPPPPVYQAAPAVRPMNVGSLVALVISLIALIAIIFFMVLRGGSMGGGTAYDPETEALRAEVAKKRLQLGMSGTSDTSTGLTAEALSSRIQMDAQTLGDLMSEITDRLAAKDRIIEQKNAEIDNAARARESLTAEIATLTKKLNELRLNEAEYATLKRQLEDSKMLLDSANKEVERLRARLNSAPSASSLEAALSKLAISEEEILRLKSRLTNMPDSDTVARLQRENKRLLLEIQRLRAEMNRERLFAESSDLLSPRALALYNRLTALEGSSNSERLEAYRQIRDELKAHVVENVSFSTGASNINVEKVAVIQQSLKDTSQQSEYLVVGYASKSGDVTSNRELSSKRATTVATVADIERGDTQTVKGVFLGQTDRFSKSNDYSNQICEIWEIE